MTTGSTWPAPALSAPTPSRRRLVFYNDATTFGGHELMTLHLVQHLAVSGRFDICFIASVHNSELLRRLTDVRPAVEVQTTAYHSGRGQWLRSYLSPRALLHLVRLLRNSGAGLLVVVQGGIALSSLALLAGRLAGVRTLSYLPMTHDETLFAAGPLQARVRQALVRPFYRLPQALVTISPRMQTYAARRRRGAIHVVENGISSPAPAANRAQQRQRLRAELQVPEHDRLLLMMGRIEIAQKRHDLALQALALAHRRGAHLQLLVVGAGPDETALRQQVQALGLDGVVHLRGWQQDVSAFYAACDGLLLPSRYEGVPLVMLEAMQAGLPIIASAVDGMADMLPPAWTFAEGDAQALANRLCQRPGAADASHLQRHQQLMATRHSLQAFGERFTAVLDHEWAEARHRQGVAR